MKWFKFYGQDYLSDPKVLALSASERSCWITLLSYGSINDNGVITFLDEQQLMMQAGVSPMHEEWDATFGVLKKLEMLKMITIKDDVITILNWQKRQETSLTGYERVKRHREKQKNAVINDNAKITSDKIRIDKNRIESSTLSYEEPLKETYKTKTKVYGKLGIPYTPPKKTKGQANAWDTELLARHIQDKAMEFHRIEVYVNKSESGKGWKSLTKVIKEFGLDKCKEMSEFYLNSEKFEKFGADVATMFSEHSINAFLTKPKANREPTAWAGDLPLYGNSDIQDKLNNKIIKFNQLKQSYEKI